jgi:hypothetical protein
MVGTIFDLVEPMNQFYQDKFYTNPDNVRRKLSKINRDRQIIDWENKKINKEKGYLRDDTTLIAIRKQGE